MTYREFVDGLNCGTIKKASFSVENYAHYRNCVVEVNPSSPVGKIIVFYLTPDGYEKQGFLKKVKEDRKLFYLKNQGSFTLKQMWNRIKIHSIE